MSADSTADTEYHYGHLVILMKKKWTDYLTRNDCLRVLCKWRADCARKRAPLHWLWIAAKGMVAPVVACPDNVSSCLPPRRRWLRLGSAVRLRLGEDRLVEETVFRTAMRDLSQPDDLQETPAWINRFKQLLHEVDSLCNASRVNFKAPTLHLVQKSKGSSRRCLASFDNIQDRLLLSRAAMYLRDVFDPLLSDDCFAFRRDSKFNYRSAIEDLVRYRMKHEGKKIYVAECDIQSFFDVVNQQTVIDAYDSFVCRLENVDRPPEQLKKILIGYLEAYTSRGNLMTSNDPKVVAFRHLVKPLEDTGVFKFYRNKKARELVRLGIPQGGALSPLLANIVLDVADRAVREDADPELFYARFCDDVIFMHPNRAKCKAAIERYMCALKKLKLPIHPLTSRVIFDAKYYDSKSKGPFAWCKPDAHIKTHVPWVSFLGVHVRYDGIVRVRKDSLDRHEENLRRETKRVKLAVGVDGANLKDTSEEGKESLLRRFEARIVAMGSGYSTMRRPDIGNRCWMSAFPSLSPDGPAAGQMHHLDSVRGHQIAALRKQLGLKAGRRSSGQKGFYGRPYSYYGALLDVERHKSFPCDPVAYSRW